MIDILSIFSEIAELHWCSRDLTDDKLTLVQVMACAVRQQAITWTYVSQVLCHWYGVIRIQWVKRCSLERKHANDLKRSWKSYETSSSPCWVISSKCICAGCEKLNKTNWNIKTINAGGIRALKYRWHRDIKLLSKFFKLVQFVIYQQRLKIIYFLLGPWCPQAMILMLCGLGVFSVKFQRIPLRKPSQKSYLYLRR